MSGSGSSHAVSAVLLIATDKIPRCLLRSGAMPNIQRTGVCPMQRYKSFLLPLAAGLLGGLLSHYAMPISASAQSEPAAPKEIRAQRFLLMNEKGEIGGVLGFDNSGKPAIALYSDGRETFSAGGKQIRPLLK
jgi:hypothetical protein